MVALGMPRYAIMLPEVLPVFWVTSPKGIAKRHYKVEMPLPNLVGIIVLEFYDGPDTQSGPQKNVQRNVQHRRRRISLKALQIKESREGKSGAWRTPSPPFILPGHKILPAHEPTGLEPGLLRIASHPHSAAFGAAILRFVPILCLCKYRGWIDPQDYLIRQYDLRCSR